MIQHKIFLIFLLFLALCGCQNHSQFRQQLSLADTLMLYTSSGQSPSWQNGLSVAS